MAVAPCATTSGRRWQPRMVRVRLRREERVTRGGTSRRRANSPRSESRTLPQEMARHDEPLGIAQLRRLESFLVLPRTQMEPHKRSRFDYSRFSCSSSVVVARFAKGSLPIFIGALFPPYKSTTSGAVIIPVNSSSAYKADRPPRFDPREDVSKDDTDG